MSQDWNQVPGLDCGNTFALCLLFAKHPNDASHIDCSGAGLGVFQLDVKTAFLYADIDEEVFVAQPPGYETTDNDGGPLVMRLEKSLYGLAQNAEA